MEKKLKDSKIPIEVALWDAATIADYLKCSRQHVYHHITSLPSFPERIKVETKRGKGTGKPLWKALDVIGWVENQK